MLLDLQVPRECRDLLVLPGQQEPRETLVCLDHLEHLGPPKHRESKGPRGRPESLVGMVPRGFVEARASLVLPGHQANRVQQEIRVSRDRRASWGCRGTKVTRERAETRDTKDPRGSRAEMESQGPPDPRAKRDPREEKERRE